MQSFINLGRKIFFKFSDVTVTLQVILGQRSRCKMKARYDFLFQANRNYMPIWYRFQDIGPFNNLLLKLINLITMA